jgi:hypothetical protein
VLSFFFRFEILGWVRHAGTTNYTKNAVWKDSFQLTEAMGRSASSFFMGSGEAAAEDQGACFR